MSENAIFALIPILGISIPIFGILLTGFRRWADLKEKQLQNTASATAEQAAQYAGRRGAGRTGGGAEPHRH